MRKTKTAKVVRNLAALAIIAGPLTAAMATNGYFSHGYGMKAKGMGGASVAMTDDAFAGANNPAIAAWVGNRAELGLDFFMPSRESSNTGGASAKSDSNLFYVPEFGYNRAINDKLGVGITVYGNGGMNTDYPVNFFGGTPALGVNLIQLIVAPTVAYKFSDKHSVGVSPLLVHQRFKAEGLSPFAGYSASPGALTNNGYDTSNGIGVRLGYLGKINDKVTLGASYSPKISMSKFSKYAGLFAEDGGFDIPENYTLGASFQATPSVLFALDYQRIGYSGVRAISNPSGNLLLGKQLGAADGPGFGWSDINVWKVGVQWQATPQLTMRGGVNVGDNPVQGRDVTFNILAPGVVTTHYTLGGTYALSDKTEVSFSYMYAPSNSVTGANLLNPAVQDTVKMSQQALGIQFGWRY
ncbi:MAG: long-chain fatty acid transporter [Rhodoferax sp.]|uniref:OmpP1/FadL family transporter n=1 Tax=Rhodoferax sp. TaxID=50421 RepID=UPI0018291430|nr:outer membrane protein transport protein [Rhodoferax sp.]NMM12535.1 long-chain fatty acid transporter [Rhodoferax sp.]NMM21760.1 long-chain fatty acid transporter [Rhodoferax sp.]